jgi:hypothetical protein
MSIFSGLYSEDEIADRFNVSLRVVREHARSKGIGHKFGRKRWFTETEVVGLMDNGNAVCLPSRGGTRGVHRSCF